MSRLVDSVRSRMTSFLVVGALAGFVPFAGAQTGGGGGLSAVGGGGGGGGSGASSLGGTTLSSGGGIGSSKTSGSGNISSLRTSTTGLNSLSTTTTSKGSSGGYPSSSDTFLPFYSSPLQPVSSGTTTGGFGTPQYPITASTTANVKPQSGKSTNTGFTTFNYRKNPVYSTKLSEDFPLVQHPVGQLRADVQDVLARSSSLKLPGQIGVTVFDGGMVVLSGNVSSAKERRLAESLICVTPGVRRVENQLTIIP